MLNAAYELTNDIVIFSNYKLEKFENIYKFYDGFKEFVINSLRVEELIESNKVE